MHIFWIMVRRLFQTLAADKVEPALQLPRMLLHSSAKALHWELKQGTIMEVEAFLVFTQNLRKFLWELCQPCLPASSRLDFLNPGVMAQSFDRLQLPGHGFESCENQSFLVSSLLFNWFAWSANSLSYSIFFAENKFHSDLVGVQFGGVAQADQEHYSEAECSGPRKTLTNMSR